MEEPYRFFKKLQKLGNSKGLIIPMCWFKFKGNEAIIDVVVEVTKKQIIIKPYG